MIDSQLLTFAVAAAILTITPGADTMLVVRNVLTRGTRAGLVTTVGICCGCLAHAVLSALGVSLILVRSAVAFETLKLAGAAYLVLLGLQSLWRCWRDRAPGPSDLERQHARAPGGAERSRSFSEGLLTNVLNPKVGIFYLAFLPQFISATDPVLLKSLALAAIHIAMGALWLSLISLGLGKPRRLIESLSLRRALEATAGAVLIALGVRLALERR